MGIVIMAAIVVSFVSWIYLGWMLYREHHPRANWPRTSRKSNTWPMRWLNMLRRLKRLVDYGPQEKNQIMKKHGDKG